MKFALLCSSPDTGAGTFSPFSFGAYRIQAAVLFGENMPKMDVKIFEQSNLSIEEWEEVIEEYNPDIIGMSAFVWSFPTWVELSRRLKINNPNRLVLFGGPSAAPSVFQLPPFQESAQWIDAFVVGEGEWITQEIIRRYVATQDRSSLLGIANVWVSNGQTWTQENKENLIRPYYELPSPFQNGLIPKGVTGHLEASRGCPLNCRFCQWGDVSIKGDASDLDYLIREMQAFKDLDTVGTLLIDAGLNLNVKAFQNLVAAENQVGLFKDNEFHTEVYPSLLTDRHVDFLSNTKASIGLGLQSTNPDALRFHKRFFKLNNLENVVEKLHRSTHHISVEIIMGLPGDTPEGFLRTLEYAKSLNVDNVRIFHCLVLPTALMDKNPLETQMVFDPMTLEIQSCLGWSEQDINDMAAYLTENDNAHDDYSVHSWPRPPEAAEPSYHWGKIIAPSIWHAKGQRDNPHLEHAHKHEKDPIIVDSNLIATDNQEPLRPVAVEPDQKQPEVSEPTLQIPPQFDKLREVFMLIAAKMTAGKLICELVYPVEDRIVTRLLSPYGPIKLHISQHHPNVKYYKRAKGLVFRYEGEIESDKLRSLLDLFIVGCVKNASKTLKKFLLKYCIQETMDTVSPQ